jgi:hypothetical protein
MREVTAQVPCENRGPCRTFRAAPPVERVPPREVGPRPRRPPHRQDACDPPCGTALVEAQIAGGAVAVDAKNQALASTACEGSASTSFKDPVR